MIEDFVMQKEALISTAVIETVTKSLGNSSEWKEIL